jgi:hypothetical protein
VRRVFLWKLKFLEDYELQEKEVREEYRSAQKPVVSAGPTKL